MAFARTSLIGRALRQRRRGFLRDDLGATAVEVGLLAPVFFLIIGAILETAVVFLSSQVLDSAVHDASRLVRTGQVRTTTVETFKTSVCDGLYGLFDCSKLHVEVQPLGTFSAANITPPVDYACKTAVECEKWTRNEAVDTGSTSAIMVAQVYYRWPVILNFGGFTLANLSNGSRVLGSATVFRNEPF
ncbi:MAG TPA: TadE/TadG family type IV pilus assembly protein [Devosia sp.]|jgi:Flp pilus assembly protein TadG|uniref:TadE/TadG family type IV pilus assembly protein n=1 Tax=Devosia sp. TaxID=1871048 RepID=UPI002F946CBC